MKPTLTFDEAYARLHKAEGGFSLDRKDPGNWTGGRVGVGKLLGTKYGIAANTYPDVDIKNLTPAQAKAIYYRDWWLKAGGEHFHAAIIYQLWDFAVNSGMSNAKRKLQKAAGVTDDGIIGPVTISIVRAMDLNDLLFLFNAEKIEFYTSLTTWPTYGKGWMNRTAMNLRYCASDNVDLPPAIVGIIHPHEMELK